MSVVYQILIVEDDPDQRALFSQILALRGYDVVVVPDGETALERLAEREFDLLLSDWYLPGIDGDELIREVKRQPNPPKAILMSSHFNVREAALASGADDYLQKIELHKLFDLVAKLTAKSPAPV